MFMTDWKKVIKDLPSCFVERQLTDGAAALAYYLMFSVFPMMIVFLTLIPYLPIENLDQMIMNGLREMLPEESATMFIGTVESITNERRGGLLSIGILVAIWSASNGFVAIMTQMNNTYGIKESRNYFKVRGIALGLMVVSGLLIVAAAVLVILGGFLHDWVTSFLSLGGALSVIFAIIRWVVILFLFSLSLSLVYYMAPSVEQSFKFITPGGLLATVLIIATSLLFRLYISNFGDYNATYGSIGAVMIFMLWLYITGLVLLLGGQLNALVEHHSKEGKELGERKMQGQPSPAY